MAESTNPPEQPPRFSDAETALGGADAVEKTTYVVGQGTDPEARAPGGGHPPPVERTGPNPLVWAVVGIAIVIALIYFLGFGGR